jgi:hypothetical protein
MNTRHEYAPQAPAAATYDSAIAKAVEWLGDRYLLAKPIKAAPRGERPVAPRVHLSHPWESMAPSQDRYRRWLMRSTLSQGSSAINRQTKRFQVD